METPRQKRPAPAFGPGLVYVVLGLRSLRWSPAPRIERPMPDAATAGLAQALAFRERPWPDVFNVGAEVVAWEAVCWFNWASRWTAC